jgi:hypothetical protein
VRQQSPLLARWAVREACRIGAPVHSSTSLSIARNCDRSLGLAAPKGYFRWRRPRHTLKGRQDAQAVDRVGLRRKRLTAQAEAGDIVLLFGDESDALTHPYLAHAWAKKAADLRIPAPGQAAKVAMLGLLEGARGT